MGRQADREGHAERRAAQALPPGRRRHRPRPHRWREQRRRPHQAGPDRRLGRPAGRQRHAGDRSHPGRARLPAVALHRRRDHRGGHRPAGQDQALLQEPAGHGLLAHVLQAPRADRRAAPAVQRLHGQSAAGRRLDGQQGHPGHADRLQPRPGRDQDGRSRRGDAGHDPVHLHRWHRDVQDRHRRLQRPEPVHAGPQRRPAAGLRRRRHDLRPRRGRRRRDDRPDRLHGRRDAGAVEHAGLRLRGAGGRHQTAPLRRPAGRLRVLPQGPLERDRRPLRRRVQARHQQRQVDRAQQPRAQPRRRAVRDRVRRRRAPSRRDRALGDRRQQRRRGLHLGRVVPTPSATHRRTP